MSLSCRGTGPETPVASAVASDLLPFEAGTEGWGATAPGEARAGQWLDGGARGPAPCHTVLAFQENISVESGLPVRLQTFLSKRPLPLGAAGRCAQGPPGTAVAPAPGPGN